MLSRRLSSAKVVQIEDNTKINNKKRSRLINNHAICHAISSTASECFCSSLQISDESVFGVNSGVCAVICCV